MAATAISSSLLLQGLASSRTSLNGTSLLVKPAPAAARAGGVLSICCRSGEVDQEAVASGLSRRWALALLAGSVAASSRIGPANAAYGEAANVFGSPKQETGFVPFSGDGFKLEIPAKWNPSKESEFPGTVLRYEDNFDLKSNLAVMVIPTDKSSITDYGSPEKFLESVSYLLGKQTYSGKTVSEGGFERDAVATASLMSAAKKEVNGQKYYSLDVLTRTADGDEGGTHQLIVGSVANGKLYILKAQAGDKRWFKGAQKFVKGAAESFSLA
ncbi:hypothetical protein O6H91_05G086100 [Diphasiastrum complanatum]|uniref:Uncharacterized protein n=1 Tax=Diphasiastrum complanatum TaxID=34168 RepID=A0ACC2DQA6_DIPCM|nr:hypothetical protein O6H91_05G086100 [Diphasiastrum complanatum]